MVPRDEDPTQPPRTMPDHDPFDPCPLCDRTGVPFDVRLSALLDWLEVLETTMQDVKKAAQALVA